MKKLMVLLLLAIFNLTINAQEAGEKNVKNDEQPSGAEISFKEEVVDYGTIEKGADGVRKFEFTNTGTEPLIVSRVYSTCGCTVPKKPEKPIAPGDSGVIEVKYDTKRVGPIRKTITVYSNASQIPYPLKIKGTIVDTKK